MAIFDSTSYPNGYYSLRLTSYDSDNKPYVFTVYNIYFNNPANPILPTLTITQTNTVSSTIIPTNIPSPTSVTKKKGSGVIKPPKPH